MLGISLHTHSSKKRISAIIRKTPIHPDIVTLLSSKKKDLTVIELTVPHETRIEKQHMFKSKKSGDLTKQLKQKAGVMASMIAAEELEGFP